MNETSEEESKFHAVISSISPDDNDSNTNDIESSYSKVDDKLATLKGNLGDELRKDTSSDSHDKMDRASTTASLDTSHPIQRYKRRRLSESSGLQQNEPSSSLNPLIHTSTPLHSDEQISAVDNSPKSSPRSPSFHSNKERKNPQTSIAAERSHSNSSFQRPTELTTSSVNEKKQQKTKSNDASPSGRLVCSENLEGDNSFLESACSIDDKNGKGTKENVSSKPFHSPYSVDNSTKKKMDKKQQEKAAKKLHRTRWRGQCIHTLDTETFDYFNIFFDIPMLKLTLIISFLNPFYILSFPHHFCHSNNMNFNPIHGDNETAHQIAEDYVNLAGNIMYPNIQFSSFGYDPLQNQYPLEHPTTLGLLTHPIRRPTVVEKWSPHEIAMFEAALCIHGKQFHIVQRIVQSKNTKDIVEFYYVWKKTSHYKMWKKHYDMDEDSSDDEDEEKEEDEKEKPMSFRGRVAAGRGGKHAKNK